MPTKERYRVKKGRFIPENKDESVGNLTLEDYEKYLLQEIEKASSELDELSRYGPNLTKNKMRNQFMQLTMMHQHLRTFQLKR